MKRKNLLINLEGLGWDHFFEAEFRKAGIPDTVPARVTSQHKDLCIIQDEKGELAAAISGRIRYRAGAGTSYPVVGDWVAASLRVGERSAVIRAVLPRKSSFSRQATGGRVKAQVLVANIDIVFLVSGLDGGRNLNLRRIERYLMLAWNSGARPVIILNKVDLCKNIEPVVREAEGIAPGVPVHAISATERIRLDTLRQYLTGGNTAALLGHSGTGKSAIINALLGEERLKVGSVREADRRGRHTTTRRELLLLPGGGAVIDTPGMRGIQVRGDEEGLRDTFEDIESLAGQCRFYDCAHDKEPGCAVRGAIESGSLDPARLNSYRKLQLELRHQTARENNNARLEEKFRWKRISQMAKQLRKHKQ